jgi:3-isopropylmalate dehydrogenase
VAVSDEVGDGAYRLAVIGGDGVGPEVVAEGLKVLDAVEAAEGLATRRVAFDLGARRYRDTGEVLPDATLAELRGFDAVYFGAVGAPGIPPGVLERGLLLRLRFTFDLYVNLRPVKLYPEVRSPIAGLTPDRCDLVVVRENTEGVYTGSGGQVYRGSPAEVATQESVNTRRGVERVVRYAFDLARRRRGHLTLCHKTNVLTHAGDLWARTVGEVGREYPDVDTDYVHVDAMCLHLVTRPERFDVVVTDNLFGDIVTDLGAAVQGGMGLAASGNLDPERRSPSLFEPVHGSAPDIAGTGRADPTAAVLSLAMLLDFLGERKAADRVERAVTRWLAARGDRGMGYSTTEAGDHLAELASA